MGSENDSIKLIIDSKKVAIAARELKMVARAVTMLTIAASTVKTASTKKTTIAARPSTAVIIPIIVLMIKPIPVRITSIIGGTIVNGASIIPMIGKALGAFLRKAMIDITIPAIESKKQGMIYSGRLIGNSQPNSKPNSRSPIVKSIFIPEGTTDAIPQISGAFDFFGKLSVSDSVTSTAATTDVASVISVTSFVADISSQTVSVSVFEFTISLAFCWFIGLISLVLNVAYYLGTVS